MYLKMPSIQCASRASTFAMPDLGGLLRRAQDQQALEAEAGDRLFVQRGQPRLSASGSWPGRVRQHDGQVRTPPARIQRASGSSCCGVGVHRARSRW